MKITGTIKTEQLRKLRFEFSTVELGKSYGTKNCWYDNSHHIDSVLKIEGQTIDYGENSYFDLKTGKFSKKHNFIFSEQFEKMFNNCTLESIDTFELNQSETDHINKDIVFYIRECLDAEQFFLDNWEIDSIDNVDFWHEFKFDFIETLYDLDTSFKDFLLEAWYFSNGSFRVDYDLISEYTCYTVESYLEYMEYEQNYA